MSSDSRVHCPTNLGPGVSLVGVPANAFRVIADGPSECVLDFLVYSANENRAEVVARIRVPNHFLAMMRDRLVSALKEIAPKQEPPVRVLNPSSEDLH